MKTNVLESPASLLLTIALPPTYPTVPPSLTLSFPPTAPTRPPHLSPADFPPLLTALDPTIAESLGTAMVFTLHSSLKESIESLIQSRLDAIADAEEDVKRIQQEEEDRKFAGERVTRAGFLKWREGFLREREQEEEERVREEGVGRGGKGGKGGEEEGKMTGRMLWEGGMVGRGGEEEEEGEGV